jgi:hypothetical protein
MIDIHRDIRIGAKFTLHPGIGSHSKESTKMAGPMPKGIQIEPHIREFVFKSVEWIEYHHKRFKKL